MRRPSKVHRYKNITNGTQRVPTMLHVVNGFVTYINLLWQATPVQELVLPSVPTPERGNEKETGATRGIVRGQP